MSIRYNMKLSTLTVGEQLMWQHRYADALKHQAKAPKQLQRTVTVIAIFSDYIKTDFGDYFISDGFNTDAPCGCNRFCNCYGTIQAVTYNKAVELL